MRVRYLLVTVGLGLVAIAAVMLIIGGSVAAQDPVGAQGDPGPQAPNSVTCWATVDGSGAVYGSSNAIAVYSAVNVAEDGDLVKVSGYCLGTTLVEGVDATAYITKDITLRGGYNRDWVYDPDAFPTTLDAWYTGRVVIISGTNGATLDSLHMVRGTTPVGEDGGGIYLTNGAVATVTHSTVCTNTADGDGGGIYLTTGAAATVTHSTVSSNTADWNGGGIYLADGAVATVAHSTVSSNYAVNRGGGIYNTSAAVDLVNSTVSDNEVNEEGGGIFNINGTVNLTHSTISDNEARDDGGGIYNAAGTVNLKDTIVADQRVGGDCGWAAMTSQGHNLDSDGSCDLSPLENDIVGGTAGLSPLQVNAPGETATHALGPNSDAHNAGDCAGGTVTDDQRGVARPRGDACDIGAYEAEVRCRATVDGSGTVHRSANSRAVRDAVADAAGGDLVKVSGYCAGVKATEGVIATVYISKDITLRGGYNKAWTYDLDAYPTTLDAGYAGRVVVISSTHRVTLDSLHIVSGTTSVDESGGGVYVTAGATATVTHSTVFSNAAGYGGGVSVDWGAAATVTHSTVLSNTAVWNGGGIHNALWTTLNLAHSTVSGNEAANGGGIQNSLATLNLAHSTISGNVAGQDGGGIHNVNFGTLSLTDCTVSGNEVPAMGGEGGGIYNWNATVDLANSTVSGNESGYDGGGIYNDDGTLNLTNSTISGNDAEDWGGGILNLDATANLTHCTVSDNQATVGGGVLNLDATVNLKDTIVADQRSGGDCNGSTAVTSLGHNLDSDNTCDLSPAQNDIPGGTADLGPLLLNAPGETATHALGPNSDALNAGDCAGGAVHGDQRGVARPQGDACDIGAYEARLALTVRKTARVATARVGQQIRYTYRVTNTGDLTLSNVRARDDRLGDVSLAAEALAPGASTVGKRSYTVVGTDLPGPLVNTVTVSGTPPVGDDVIASDDASVALTEAVADLAIRKRAGLDQGTVTYTLTVRNRGPDGADGATVVDALPAGVTGATWTCTASGGATCSASGSGDVADTLASFPASGVVTYIVVGSLDTRGLVANTATVTPPQGVSDPDLDNNTATAHTQAGYHVLLPLVLKAYQR